MVEPMRADTDTVHEVVFAARDVTKEFNRRSLLSRRSDSVTRALNGVSFDVYAGESFGIVGESGSGKTTIGRILMGFETPSAGTVEFRGQPIEKMKREDRTAFRRQVQMVFQNPYASLNPFRTVRDMLSDGLRHAKLSTAERSRAMEELMEQVGLNDTMLDRYPHEFSGGQRQRIVLARALSIGPSVLIADEPVSALDVSIQAQVLNLLNSFRRELGLTTVMVTHDLRVVNFFCDRIAVMYRGHVVELASRERIMNASHHPYTQMLLSAAPRDEPGEPIERPWVRGEIEGDQAAGDAGCPFASRCWLRQQLGNPERCVTERPADIAVGGSGGAEHTSACHFATEVPERAMTAVGSG